MKEKPKKNKLPLDPVKRNCKILPVLSLLLCLLDVSAENSFSESYKYIYFHSLAGNVLRTIAPVGVIPLDASHFDADGVWDGTDPSHLDKQKTDYRYNSLGQVIEQKTPTAGETSFNYDFAQRLRASQNAEQALGNEYSYTKHDPLNRITEVGQYQATTAPTETELNNPLWPLINTSEQTYTSYDESMPGSSLSAKNLRNRVAVSENENIKTEYSYDAHGNVERMRHTLADLPSYPFDLAMEYDLISGNVKEVKFQGGKQDQFHHRYQYDADNRLTNVQTSDDGYIYEMDASYSYYTHGPLARVVLGEDEVQGVDYFYTLQGWIKGMNGGTRINDPSQMLHHDIGSDGIGGSLIPKDEFAMNLSYHENDYKAIGIYESSRVKGWQ